MLCGVSTLVIGGIRSMGGDDKLLGKPQNYW